MLFVESSGYPILPESSEGAHECVEGGLEVSSVKDSVFSLILFWLEGRVTC